MQGRCCLYELEVELQLRRNVFKQVSFEVKKQRSKQSDWGSTVEMILLSNKCQNIEVVAQIQLYRNLDSILFPYFLSLYELKFVEKQYVPTYEKRVFSKIMIESNTLETQILLLSRQKAFSDPKEDSPIPGTYQN